MGKPEQIDIGMRIRNLRESRGQSQRALASASGLSANAISLIERGENSPTVASLYRLAAALDVPLTAFFADEDAQAAVFVPCDHRLCFEDSGITMESLGLGLFDQHLEPFVLELEIGSAAEPVPITHPGEELVYCLEGVILCRVGNQTYFLEPGDSLLFKAEQPHWFRNSNGNPARMLLVLEAGEGQESARRRHLKVNSTG